MTQDWAVGKVEQLIILDQLEKRLNSLELMKSGIMISSYVKPTRQEWESRYKLLGGELPIVPGAKLCWYNMRTNLIEVFTTAFDNDSGGSSSGDIYEYVTLPNVSPIRFLGQVNMYNQLIMNGDTPGSNISFGLNWTKWQQLNLYKIRIFFRVYNTNTLQFTVDPRLQPLPTTYAYRVINGKCQIPGPATAAANPQSTVGAPDPDIDIPSPDGGTSTTLPMTGVVDIYSPYRVKESGGERSRAAAWNMQGWLFNLPGGATANNLFFSVRTTIQEPFFQLSEMSPVQQLATPTLESTAWAYGYFAESLETVKEFDNDD